MKKITLSYLWFLQTHLTKIIVLFIFIYSGVQFEVYGQQPAANLDQIRNGSTVGIKDPGEWVNGNLGDQQSHYAEGMSIPYRVVMTNIPGGTYVELTLAYDVKHSGKNAIDFLTQYDRIEPHAFTFLHDKEVIDPTINVTGLSSGPVWTAIPPPPSNEIVNSKNQPFESYSLIAGGNQHRMALWNATFTGPSPITYGPGANADLNLDKVEQQITIKFTVDGLASEKKTVLLSWGGHIASRIDWGEQNGVPESAGGISGSPYHMRLINWNLNNLGNQDRSLSASAVTPPPSCTLNAEDETCEGEINEFTLTPLGAFNPSYSWEIIDNTAGATFETPPSNSSLSTSVNTTQEGGYTVKVTITSVYGTNICTFPVVVDESPDAGGDGSAQFCEGDSSKSGVSLVGLLTGTPDSGGSWSETSATSSGLTLGDGTSLDFTGVSAGVYTFKYTVTPAQGSTCPPDDATVTITIDPLPNPPSIETVQSDCLPGSQGSAAFTYSDEVPAFYYSYKSATDETAEYSSYMLYAGPISLDPGSYTFKIKYTVDGCESDAFNVTIIRPNDDIVDVFTDVIQPDCATGLGSISVTNIEDLATFKFTVFDSSTDTPITGYQNVDYPSGGFTGLPIGSYRVFGISASGCLTGNGYADLLEPECLTCETAFAKDNESGICFSAVDGVEELIPNINRWGWTNYYDGPVSATLDLWAGAGQCDTSKGSLSGHVEVIPKGNGVIDVKFVAYTGWVMNGVHLYVGCTEFPYKKKGKNYDFTVAPGQYTHNPNGDIGTVTEYTIEGVQTNGSFYLIAHADMCTSADADYVQELRDESVPGTYLLKRNSANMLGCISTSRNSKAQEDLAKASPVEGPQLLEESRKPMFDAYPIPFRENLNIGYKFDYTSDVTIQIYNMNGQLLKTYKEKNVDANSISNLNIDFQRRSSAIYIVRMITDREVFVKKIISDK